MSRFAQIIATQESLEEQQALGTAQDDVSAAETAAEVAEVTGEVNQDVNEIETIDAGIDDAEGAQDSIAELQGVAEASLAADGEQVAEGELGEDGDGMTANEAAVVEITHESIMRSLGFPVQRKTYTPESFNDKRTSRQVTMEALEGLKESAKKVGEGIVRALKAAFDTVVGFIAKIINNRALMERHLNNLAKRVAEAKDGAKKEDKLKAGAGALSLNGSADSGTAIRVLEGTHHCLDQARKIAEFLYQNKEKNEAFADDLTNLISSLPANGKGKGILGGGKAFEVGEEGNSMKLSVIDASPVAEEITAPSKSDMQRVIEAARKTLMGLREAEKIRSRLKDVVDAISKLLVKAKTAVTSRVGSEASRGQASVDGFINDNARSTRAVLNKYMTATFSHSFRAVKAAADYVSAGLKNLGEEAAAPTESTSREVAVR